MYITRIRIFLDNHEEIVDIWNLLTKHLPHISDQTVCRASMYDDILHKPFREVDAYYRDNPDLKYFKMTTKKGVYVHYFKLGKDILLKIPLAYQDSKIQSLMSEVTSLLKFSNITLVDEDYVRPFVKKPFVAPPKSLVYEAPNLANLRGYYIEGVSAEMWFGESFWQYASCSREEVIACDWLETEEKENGVLYVKAYHKPLDSREPEQLAIQRRLLKLLFNIDENRPHGYEPTGAKLKTFVQKAYTDGQTTIVGDLKEQSE